MLFLPPLLLSHLLHFLPVILLLLLLFYLFFRHFLFFYLNVICIFWASSSPVISAFLFRVHCCSDINCATKLLSFLWSYLAHCVEQERVTTHHTRLHCAGLYRTTSAMIYDHFLKCQNLNQNKPVPIDIGVSSKNEKMLKLNLIHMIMPN